MINWKTCIGLTLFMGAVIECLEFKDNYQPDRITSSMVLLTSGLILSVTIATFLVVQGLRRS